MNNIVIWSSIGLQNDHGIAVVWKLCTTLRVFPGLWSFLFSTMVMITNRRRVDKRPSKVPRTSVLARLYSGFIQGEQSGLDALNQSSPYRITLNTNSLLNKRSCLPSQCSDSSCIACIPVPLHSGSTTLDHRVAPSVVLKVSVWPTAGIEAWSCSSEKWAPQKK